MMSLYPPLHTDRIDRGIAVEPWSPMWRQGCGYARGYKGWWSCWRKYLGDMDYSLTPGQGPAISGSLPYRNGQPPFRAGHAGVIGSILVKRNILML